MQHGKPRRCERVIRNWNSVRSRPGRFGVADGFVVVTTPGNAGRAKEPWLRGSVESDDSREIGVNLITPQGVEKLQTALHVKAKGSPDCRFHQLYDKVYRRDVLQFAYAQCYANRGKPGVDGQTFDDINEYGTDRWLDELAEELRSKTYEPQPVRRVWIPKSNGGQRPLGIPTIRDRVVQTAAVLVLEPIFEADLQPEQYAYRRGKSALDAVRHVRELVNSGHAEVIDADLSGYFDTIPHCDLMKSVARRVSDKHVLHLLKMWLVAPTEEIDKSGYRHRTTGNRNEKRGTPQGQPFEGVVLQIFSGE